MYKELKEGTETIDLCCVLFFIFSLLQKCFIKLKKLKMRKLETVNAEIYGEKGHFKYF